MTPEKLSLKRAIAETIKGVGGLEAAAGFCRVGKSALSDNQSPSKPESFMAVDVALDLEPLARDRDGWPHVTRVLAAANGFALVKLPDAMPTAGELIGLIGKLAKEHADVATTLCAALSDQKIEAAEARAIRAEIAANLQILVTLDAAVAAAGEQA